MRYFEKEGSSLVWRNKNETVVITPWGENSLRVRSALVQEVQDTRFALTEPLDTQPEIELHDETARIRNGKITAEVHMDDWHGLAFITFKNQKGEVLLKELDPCHALQLQARRFEPHLGGDYALTQSFYASENERIWGMGQYQEENLNWKGAYLELAQRNSQITIPFYISSLGYGFLWHNPALGHVHFGTNRTVWHAESTKMLDYWITAGDTPAEISLAYARATGFAPIMPEYGLGFWQCKLRYWNQEQLLNVAREYKRRNLPIDVIVCDFFHWPKLGDFRFDPEFFPDPEGMVRELKEMGIELMVSVWPLISLTSENYREMLQKGYLVRAEYGVQISKQFVEDSINYDATNPSANGYVWNKCKKNYYDKGIRLFWLDEAEPNYSTADFKNYRFMMGSHQQVGNIYPQLYAKAFYDGLTDAGEDKPLSLVRCAWAGSQKYGALVWSGDIMSTWEDFRKQICAGISMGVSGIPWWTTDIGGFHNGNPDDPAFRELLIRWFEWGAYCPVMRLHGDRKPAERIYKKDGSAHLSSGSCNEVYSFGEEAYAILKKYMRRREEMRPYLRKVMLEAHEKGLPVMRAMFYEFPEDKALIDLKDQYMLGSDYLVAPVLQPGAAERSVVFPEGFMWQDEETGEIYEGGQTLSVPAPLDRIPVFRKIPSGSR